MTPCIRNVLSRQSHRHRADAVQQRQAGAGEGEGPPLGLGFCFLVMECSGVKSQAGDTTWGTGESLPRCALPRKSLETPACHHFPDSCVLGQVLCPSQPQSLTSQRGCHHPPPPKSQQRVTHRPGLPCSCVPVGGERISQSQSCRGPETKDHSPRNLVLKVRLGWARSSQYSRHLPQNDNLSYFPQTHSHKKKKSQMWRDTWNPHPGEAPWPASMAESGVPGLLRDPASKNKVGST